MNRVFLAAAVLTALPLASWAGDSVVRMKVQPMSAPQPALKYQLLPEVRELTPGNPAQWYIRCFSEQRNFFFSKQGVAERARYLSMPLAELAAAKIQQRYGGGPLTQADWAARLDAIDWQVLERVQSDGLNFQQPELGPLRILGRALKARFRIEVAGGRFDDAVRTAKTMFAFARHLGENPTAAANQLGLFVANLAIDALEEMIQQRGCPNLYWALTGLPSPMVDLRKGFQGERTLIATELRPLREDKVMTAEELDKVVSRLSGVMGLARVQAGLPPRNLREGLAKRVKDIEKVNAIRDRKFQEQRDVVVHRMQSQKSVHALFDRVLEVGHAKDLMQKLSPLQIVLLEAKRQLVVQSDERLKLLALAPWQIDKLGGERLERGESCLLADFLPQVLKPRLEQGRLERRIALLRYIEALRLYAADHEGKLPEKPSDIAFPLPDDPFTGKSFVYRIEGSTAHLRGKPPRDEEKNVAYNVVYEVTLQR